MALVKYRIGINGLSEHCVNIYNDQTKSWMYLNGSECSSLEEAKEILRKQIQKDRDQKTRFYIAEVLHEEEAEI
jgi:hypothetical protein